MLVEGKKLVSELAGRYPLLSLISLEPIPLPAEESFLVSEEVFQKISGVQNPEGILAEMAMPPPQPFPAPLQRLLILEETNDPGNLGTLFRTAWALGWQGIFLLGDGCDPYNEKALRAAKGATFSMIWQKGSQEDLQRLLDRESLFLYGAEMQGEPLSAAAVQSPCALALGNEARGLSQELRSRCQLLSIPMKEGVESLNVASAGAIFLYMLGHS